MRKSNPPSKRRFWQLHLSTAVLLMFATSGFLCLNVQPTDVDYYPVGNIEHASLFGFPFKMARKFHDADDPPLQYFPNMVCANLLVLMAILISIVIISEWLIRRREGRRQ